MTRNSISNDIQSVVTIELTDRSLICFDAALSIYQDAENLDSAESQVLEGTLVANVEETFWDIDDVIDSINCLTPLERSKDLLEAAQKVELMDTIDDVNMWAKRLAEDVVDADD